MWKINLLFCFFTCSLLAKDPVAVYLTWQHKPESTMTIQWLSYSNDKQDSVFYQKIGEKKWESVQGNHLLLPTAKKYFIHRAELQNLSPGASYAFRLNSNEKLYKFRTMPSQLDSPIRFVAGGDMYHDTLPILKQTNEQAAKTDPFFVLVGGDIAYAASKHGWFPEHNYRWIDWLKAWTEQMVTPEGYLIPMLPAIGNHDVNGRYDQSPKEAKSFYSLFAFPGKQGYNVLDFGHYLSLIILDSGHTHPIEGEQSQWLASILQNRKHIPNKFALYHVPAYPSVRKLTTKMSPEIRQNWVPLFESYGLTAAFENHDHAYKRTHLIREGKVVSEDGVLYLGDGGWGADKARIPKTPSEAWYIAHSASSRNFILVTLMPDGSRQFSAFDENSNLLDHHTLPGN